MELWKVYIRKWGHGEKFYPRLSQSINQFEDYVTLITKGTWNSQNKTLLPHCNIFAETGSLPLKLRKCVYGGSSPKYPQRSPTMEGSILKQKTELKRVPRTISGENIPPHRAVLYLAHPPIPLQKLKACWGLMQVSRKVWTSLIPVSTNTCGLDNWLWNQLRLLQPGYRKRRNPRISIFNI